MVETWLAGSPWPGVILWIILYTSDYYLTIYSARGFREIGHFQFEGSFELTPQYQKDINELKPISKRHVTLLVLFSMVIALIWWLFNNLLGLPFLYLLYLGMFLLLEVAVHLRHLRNISLIHQVKTDGGVEGQIMYRKYFSYKVSSVEFYTLGGLFLMTSILTSSIFFLGGAIMCFGTGVKHGILAKKEKSEHIKTVETNENPA